MKDWLVLLRKFADSVVISEWHRQQTVHCCGRSMAYRQDFLLYFSIKRNIRETVIIFMLYWKCLQTVAKKSRLLTPLHQSSKQMVQPVHIKTRSDSATIFLPMLYEKILSIIKVMAQKSVEGFKQKKCFPFRVLSLTENSKFTS